MAKTAEYINKIVVIAHRGLWHSLDEKNTRSAIEKAFDNGFGIETDLRDIKGEIVISHDMPKGGEITFEEVLRILDGRNLPLALNIKADGQGKEIKRLLSQYHHTNYFTFDMSLPEMVVEHELGLNVYTGISDILPLGIMPDKAHGVWLDAFYDDNFLLSQFPKLANSKLPFCVVSPDLHGRAIQNPYIWLQIKQFVVNHSAKVLVCTDKPEDARTFFDEN